jgi:autotransporter translocation and assembly factor TamB
VPRLYRIATHSLLVAGFLSAVWLALLSPPAQILGSWLALKLVNRSTQLHIEGGQLRSNLLNELRAEQFEIHFAKGSLYKIHARRLQLHFDPLALFGSGSPLVRLYADGLHFYMRSDRTDTAAEDHTELLTDATAALLPPHLARWLPLEIRLRDISVLTEYNATLLTVDGLVHLQTEWDEQHSAQFALSSSALAIAQGTRHLDGIRLWGHATLDRHALRIEQLMLSTGDISLQAHGSYGADRFDAFAELRSPIQPLQHLLGGLRGTGQLDVRLQAVREGDQVHGNLTAGAHDFSYAGLPVENLDLAGRYSGGNLYLDSLRIAMAGGRLDGSGQIDLDAPSYPLQASLAAENIDAEKLGSLLATEHLAMRGLLQGRAHISADLAQPTLLRADLDLDSPDLYIGKAHPGNTHITVRFQKPDLRLHLNSEAGRLHVSGQILAADNHAFRWRLHNFNLARTGLTSLAGEIDFSATSSGHWQHPQVDLKTDLRRLRWGSFQLRQLSGQVHLDSSSVFESAWRAPHNDLQIDATGNLHSGAEAIGLHLNNVPLAHLLSPALARRWQAQLGLDLTFTGSFTDPQVRSQFNLDDIRYKEQLLGDIHGQLYIADGRSQLSISALDSTVSLQGNLQIEVPQLPFELAGHVEDADLAPFLRLAARRELKTTGRASGRLHASGHLKNLLQMHLDLDLEDLQVSLPMGQVRSLHPAKLSLHNGTIAISALEVGGTLGRLHLDGRVAQRGALALKLALEDFQLDALDPFLPLHNQPISGQVHAAMTIAGRAHAPLIKGDIALANLQYGHLELGDLHGRFNYADQRAHMPDLELALQRGGHLRGEGEWPLDLRLSADTPSPSPSPRQIQLNLRAENAVFDSLQGLPPHIELRINGQVEMRGDAAHWEEMRGGLELDALELHSPRFTLKNALPIDLRLQRNSLRVHRLDLRLLEGEVARGQIRASGHMARDAESDLSIEVLGFDLQSLPHFAAVERALAGTIDAHLTLRGQPQNPQIYAQWKTASSQLDSLRLQLLEGSASYRDEQLELHAMRAEMGNGFLEARGHIPIDLRGELLADRPLQLELKATDLAVGPLLHSRPSWPTLEADMRMDLRIEGPLGSLLTNGSISLAKGSLRVENLETPFAFAGLSLVIDSNRAQLASSGGTAATGHWEAKGTALLHNAAIDSFALEFALQNTPLAMARVFDVRGGGQLRWHGTAQASQLAGAFTIDRGLISTPINLRAATSTPPVQPGSAAIWKKNTTLNVALKMQSVQLQNDLMDMVLDGDLALAGNAAQPVLSGLVSARSGGHIFYLGHSFALARARLRFDEHKPVDDLFTLFYYPAAFDPALDIAAHTEIKAKNGNEYFVDVGVLGPFSTLDFSLHSDPPRSHVEILSLLSFGSDDVNLLDPEGAVLSQQNQMALSPDYLLRVANSRFSRVLGVDDISIDANSFKPGDIGGTRITLTKQLSQRVEMTYSTSVGYASKGRVRLNYRLDDNIFLQTERDAEGESGMDLKLKLQFR